MLLHNKLTNYIRLIHEFILSNYCPQLTAQLAVKLYQVVLK